MGPNRICCKWRPRTMRDIGCRCALCGNAEEGVDELTLAYEVLSTDRHRISGDRKCVRAPVSVILPEPPQSTFSSVR